MYIICGDVGPCVHQGSHTPGLIHFSYDFFMFVLFWETTPNDAQGSVLRDRTQATICDVRDLNGRPCACKASILPIVLQLWSVIFLVHKHLAAGHWKSHSVAVHTVQNGSIASPVLCTGSTGIKTVVSHLNAGAFFVVATKLLSSWSSIKKKKNLLD